MALIIIGRDSPANWVAEDCNQETYKGKQGKQGKHDGARNLAGSKRNRRCTRAVHQIGAVSLGLSHFLQHEIEIFLVDNRGTMGIAQSRPGTTYGFPQEWLSLTQFALLGK